MPVTAINNAGREVPITLRDVRCVQSFRDSLLSVNALWESSSTECRISDVRAIHRLRPRANASFFPSDEVVACLNGA
eukprot:3664782-Pleurochrysis_carterae.AAC.3